MPYKKIAFFIILVILLFSINNLAHSIFSTLQKQDLLVKAQKDLSKQTADNQKLKQDLARVNRPEFVESEARDKLFLTKPGEGIVVIPTTAVVISPTPTPPPVDTTPNWQKWWNVFFKS